MTPTKPAKLAAMAPPVGFEPGFDEEDAEAADEEREEDEEDNDDEFANAPAVVVDDGDVVGEVELAPDVVVELLCGRSVVVTGRRPEV